MLNTKLLEIDFDTSMGKGSEEFNEMISNARDQALYSQLKALYSSRLPSIMTSSFSPKIPKIIHHIWLGNKPLPDYFPSYLYQWKQLHPGWEFKLWTDRDLGILGKDVLQCIESSLNYGEKSDVFRSFILEQWGGVYVDVDFQPLVSLDSLHHLYDLYVGIENPHCIPTTPYHLWVGISIIASCPHHPVLKEWKKLIVERWSDVNKRFENSHYRTLNHTYFNFTEAFIRCGLNGMEEKMNIAFPTTYFYPINAKSASQRRSRLRRYRERLFQVLRYLKLMKSRPFSRICPETIAVHHWCSSWVKQKKNTPRTLA